MDASDAVKVRDFRRGAYRERREVARSMAEIVPDPPGWLTALRFDIDTEVAGGLDRGGAAAAEPRRHHARNGHAYLVYLLGAWVQTVSAIPVASRSFVIRPRSSVHTPQRLAPTQPTRAAASTIPLRRVRHENRARRTIFAGRARTLRRPQRAGAEEEPADRNRQQRRDLRSSAALGIRRRRPLAERHVRGVVRRGRRCRGRRRSRGSAEVVCDRGFGALYKRCGFNRPALDLVEHIS